MSKVETLVKIAKKRGASVHVIDPAIIPIDARAPLKCIYGCRSVYKSYSCPPYSPKPSATKRILESYGYAILFLFKQRLLPFAASIPRDERPVGPERSDLLKSFAFFISDLSKKITVALVKRKLFRTLYEMRKKAKELGYLSAWSFAAGKCVGCTIPLKITRRKCACYSNNKCWEPSKLTFAMEGAGIDAYGLFKKLGITVEIPPVTTMTDVALILVEKRRRTQRTTNESFLSPSHHQQPEVGL